MKKNLLYFIIACFCAFAICIGNVGKLTAKADSATQEQYNASAEIPNAGENGARSIGDDMFHETIDVGEEGTTSPISIVDLLDENEHPDADTVEGKRIFYSDILFNMDVFAENYTSCCGLVSMGIVLQYYHELTTQFQGQYIPDEWYYNLNPNDDKTTKIERANALRDYLREVTDLVAWGAFGDYTMPNGQSVGIKEYLRNYGPNATYFVNSKTWCLDTTNDIVSALNANIPVLVNCMDYKILNRDGTYVDKGNHVVVAYGYRRYNDKLQFLAHIGYSDLPNSYMPPEENPDPNEEYTSAWIEVDATYGYMYFGAVESDCYTTTNISGTTDCTVALNYSWDFSVTVPRVLDGMNVVGITDKGFANARNAQDIEDGFVYSGNVENVVLHDGIVSIGESAFYNSKIKTISLPSELLSIESCTFAYSEIREITLPTTLQNMGTNVFEHCYGLHKFTWSQNIAEIPAGCFKDCYNLEEISLPSTVTTIGDEAFYGCVTLPTIAIHSGITTIGDGAFSGCVGMEQFLLPDTVESLGENVFLGCNSLTVYIETYMSRPALWNVDWGTGVDQIWGCEFSNNNTYVLSFVKSTIIDGGNVGFTAPQRIGCTFTGWCIDETFASGEIYSMSTIMQATDNLRYYVGWNGSTVTIVYRDMGDKPFSGTHNTGYPTTHTNNTTTTLKSASKTGYIFKGWYILQNGVYTKITSISAESSFEYQVTLYAKWEKVYAGGGGGGRIEEFMPTVTPDEPEDESDF